MEIKISKCAANCCACETAFEHEQKVHSLVLMEDDALARRDYCAECITAAPRDGVFCAWNVRYTDPRVLEAERQEAFSPLRRLFYDLATATERMALAQAYLAAQLLRRQKVFRQIKESEENDGAERVTLFLDRAGNRLIETRDLNFTYTELDEARVQLMERLQALEAPESEPEPESETESVAGAEHAPEQSEQVEEHAQNTTS